MQKILIFIILFLSCNIKTDSIGKYNQIIIVSSDEDKVYIENTINEIFSNTTYTPQPEMEFEIKYIHPSNFEKYNLYRNIIILSLKFPVDSTADLLVNKISDINNQHQNIYILNDLYATGQNICIIKDFDSISLISNIEHYKNWILNQFRESYYNYIKKHILKNGDNQYLSDLVKNLYNYNLEIQADYKLLQVDSLKKFLWLGRGYPYRWLVFHSSKKEFFNNKLSSWEKLTELMKNTMPSITIPLDYRKNEIIKYNGLDRYLMRGIYIHKDSDTGGPFFTYIFDTNSNNEVILISGFVNYPGHSKINLLKQLELIAFTINN